MNWKTKQFNERKIEVPAENEWYTRKFEQQNIWHCKRWQNWCIRPCSHRVALYWVYSSRAKFKSHRWHAAPKPRINEIEPESYFDNVMKWRCVWSILSTWWWVKGILFHIHFIKVWRRYSEPHLIRCKDEVKQDKPFPTEPGSGYTKLFLKVCIVFGTSVPLFYELLSLWTAQNCFAVMITYWNQLKSSQNSLYLSRPVTKQSIIRFAFKVWNNIFNLCKKTHSLLGEVIKNITFRRLN